MAATAKTSGPARPPAGYGYLPLEALAYDRGDRSQWARAMAVKDVDLRAADLEDAITTLQLTDTMKGSSTMEVGIMDGDWSLLDSGFLDADGKYGHLGAVDCNYPKGSTVWWRLTQVQITGAPGTGGAMLKLSFMERPAAHLMAHTKKVKFSRAQKSRAEFIAGLVAVVKVMPIDFECAELTKTQKLKKPDPVKTPGISKSADLTIGGKTIGDIQIKEIQKTLAVCNKLRAPELAVQAIICAGCGESGFVPTATNKSSGAKGVFQVLPTWWSTIPWQDTEAQAEKFLQDGFTGTGVGAIEMAKEGKMSPGQIAVTIEGSGVNGETTYGVFLDEARKIIDAGGGVLSGDNSYTPQFNFETGTRALPHEDYWTAMNRLANDVHWALFIDGQRIFYDAETTLIRQQPAAILERGDPSITAFTCNWDARHIATEAEITVVCDPFSFRAGEVLWLKGFGPASRGSTVGLPGRWLIAELSRDIFGATSTLRLKQPDRPLPEPRNAVQRRSDSVSTGDLGELSGKMPKTIIDELVIPLAVKNHMVTGITKEMVEQANYTHGPTVTGGTSDHQGPPSLAWAADMSNGTSPTKDMDNLANDLCDLFGLPKLNMSVVSSDSNIKSTTVQGYRVQIIYRSYVGGNHTNHVHLGIRDVGGGSGGQSNTGGIHPSTAPGFG